MPRVDLSRLGTAVFVLGMHRSGTSCLTGCLDEAGMFTGNVNRSAPHNRKGNLENRAAMHLNDAVLSFNGGAWDDPPAEIEWNDTLILWRNAVLEAYIGQASFALKDPRMAVVLDGWVDGLSDWRPVATFRHPMAVAGSLNKRSGMPISKGLELWLAYNRRVLAILERRPGPVVCFDDGLDDYNRQVSAVAAQLGLEPPARFRFPEASLRSETSDSLNDLDGPVLEVYKTLQGLSVL